MSNDNLFHGSNILCDLNVTSKKQLLQEMATKLLKSRKLNNAGIACRALDDQTAGTQEPALFAVTNDIERGAVLDRLAGVHEFSFAKDFTARRLRRGAQTDQRRVTNRVSKVGTDGHFGHLSQLNKV